nr:hypothetical protein [Tanacetum cinerariifolium]
MAPRAVLRKTVLRPLNIVRPVNTAHPKTTVYSARPMSYFSKVTGRFTLKALRSTRRSSELEIILSLVKEKFNSTDLTYDKEREIRVELKRLFKPDTNDELWKLQKHIYDLTWRLYDSCGVHHVSIKKGIDIYMLVEKEYPLSMGTLTLMLVVKLLVDEDNKISRELLRKIFMQAERPRR